MAECEQVEWLRWWWLVLGKKEVSGKVFGKKGVLTICRVAKPSRTKVMGKGFWRKENH